MHILWKIILQIIQVCLSVYNLLDIHPSILPSIGYHHHSLHMSLFKQQIVELHPLFTFHLFFYGFFHRDFT